MCYNDIIFKVLTSSCKYDSKQKKQFLVKKFGHTVFEKFGLIVFFTHISKAMCSTGTELAINSLAKDDN